MEVRGSYLVFNGEFLPADVPVIKADNRAFLYGDGLFETVRMISGKACFFENHFLRLTEGMKNLKMIVPADFSKERLEEECNALAEKNGFYDGARARITSGKISN